MSSFESSSIHSPGALSQRLDHPFDVSLNTHNNPTALNSVLKVFGAINQLLGQSRGSCRVDVMTSGEEGKRGLNSFIIQFYSLFYHFFGRYIDGFFCCTLGLFRRIHENIVLSYAVYSWYVLVYFEKFAPKLRETIY